MATATWGRPLADNAAAVLPRPGDDPSPFPHQDRPGVDDLLRLGIIPPVQHPVYTYQSGADSLDEALRWATNPIGARPHKGLERTAAWIADGDGIWTRVQTRCDWISGACT